MATTFPTSPRLSEQFVQDCFHSYLKSSLTQAKVERLVDTVLLSSAEADLMITGPALCLYFAALRCTTNPPSVPLPKRRTKAGIAGTVTVTELYEANCPIAFLPFLQVWTDAVPRIQNLAPEHQHDLARIICGLNPVASSMPALSGIAADLRAVAIEISQRRTFQDRYADDLQAAINAGTRPEGPQIAAAFVPPPAYQEIPSTSPPISPRLSPDIPSYESSVSSPPPLPDRPLPPRDHNPRRLRKQKQKQKQGYLEVPPPLPPKDPPGRQPKLSVSPPSPGLPPRQPKPSLSPPSPGLPPRQPKPSLSPPSPGLPPRQPKPSLSPPSPLRLPRSLSSNDSSRESKPSISPPSRLSPHHLSPGLPPRQPKPSLSRPPPLQLPSRSQSPEDSSRQSKAPRPPLSPRVPPKDPPRQSKPPPPPPSPSRSFPRPVSPSYLSDPSTKTIEVIRETLYAALADVIERTPSIRRMIKRDPPRAYFASVAFAIFDVATTGVTPDGAVRVVMGRELRPEECPSELEPFMSELVAIGNAVKDCEAEDNADAIEILKRGGVPPESRVERTKKVLENGVGYNRRRGGGEDGNVNRISLQGRAVTLANRINALALGTTRLGEFKNRQDGVFSILAALGSES